MNEWSSISKAMTILWNVYYKRNGHVPTRIYIGEALHTAYSDELVCLTRALPEGAEPREENWLAYKSARVYKTPELGDWAIKFEHGN